MFQMQNIYLNGLCLLLCTILVQKLKGETYEHTA